MWIRSLGQKNHMEKSMATQSSILVWRIPWTEEPGRLQSMGLQRVTHDWAGLLDTLLLLMASIIPVGFLYSFAFFLLLWLDNFNWSLFYFIESSAWSSLHFLNDLTIHQDLLQFCISPDVPSVMAPLWFPEWEHMGWVKDLSRVKSARGTTSC